MTVSIPQAICFSLKGSVSSLLIGTRFFGYRALSSRAPCDGFADSSEAWRLPVPKQLGELLALVGELLSTRLMRTVLKLVRQFLERL